MTAQRWTFELCCVVLCWVIRVSRVIGFSRVIMVIMVIRVVRVITVQGLYDSVKVDV
jgi:hypothetical protein